MTNADKYAAFGALSGTTPALTGEFRNKNLRGVQRSGAAATDAQFTACSFAGAQLSFVTFINTVFTECDFTDTVFVAAELNRVDFIDCELTRTRLISATFRSVTAKDCDFSHAAICHSWVDRAFPLPRGYVRAQPQRGDRSDLFRPVLDANLFRKTADSLGIDPFVATTLINEHSDSPPLDLMAMLSALKSPTPPVFHPALVSH